MSLWGSTQPRHSAFFLEPFEPAGLSEAGLSEAGLSEAGLSAGLDSDLEDELDEASLPPVDAGLLSAAADFL